MASPLTATTAYAKIARIADPTGGLAKLGNDPQGGPSFGSLVKQAIGQVVEQGRKSDAQTQALIAGKANVVDVVTAVTETEVAVEAMVAVRDKVIQAYEEIMRMPI